MKFSFRAIDEPALGKKWQAEFETFWPAYKRWFLRQGEAKRPTYLASLRALRAHMPEIEPSYHRMVELAGGSDPAARFLSQYCPPPFFAACSQVIWLEDGPALIRSYDYSPLLCDGLIMRTRWAEQRVVAMTDSMSGVLDGMNEQGLAVSLAFGGRRVVGDGFGVSLILRYVLETCSNVPAAVEVLRRIPVHLAYNIALLDASAQHATVMIAPGEEPVITNKLISTNHQGRRYWHLYAKQVNTHGRHRHLKTLLKDKALSADALVDAFQRPPLFNDGYATGYGTVYTAAYFPTRGEIRYAWRDGELRFELDAFKEAQHDTRFKDPSGIDVALPARTKPPVHRAQPSANAIVQ